MHKDRCLLYASGELSREEAAEFEGHLSGCPGCRAWIATLSQGRAWAALATRPAPTGLAERTVRRIVPPGGGGTGPSWRLPSWPVAALLAFLGGTAFFLWRSSKETSAPPPLVLPLPPIPLASSRLGAAPAAPGELPQAAQASTGGCELGSVQAALGAAKPFVEERLRRPALYSIQRADPLEPWVLQAAGGRPRDFVWELVFREEGSRRFLYYYHADGPLKALLLSPLPAAKASDGPLQKAAGRWRFDPTTRAWVPEPAGETYLRRPPQPCGQIEGDFLDSPRLQARLERTGTALCASDATLEISLFHPTAAAAAGEPCRGYTLYGPARHVWDAVPAPAVGRDIWGIRAAGKVRLLDADDGEEVQPASPRAVPQLK